jgi:hypothetical protein
MFNRSRVQESRRFRRPAQERMGTAGNGINDLVIRAGKFFGLLCGEPFGFAVINPSSGGV